ncbi:MAG TPA: hypothetical protein PKE19_05840 [Aestuariivirga sp.]|nr:hypothetical protein [Aestuariivirga sp.]
MSNPNDRNDRNRSTLGDRNGSNWILPAIIVAALLGVALYYFMGTTTTTPTPSAAAAAR